MRTIFTAVLCCLYSYSMQSQEWHVYVFIAEDCPVCNYMGKPLQELAVKFQSAVTFHAVFPLKYSNFKTTHIFKEKYGMLSFETILDKELAITKKLGATVTPEAVITDEM